METIDIAYRTAVGGRPPRPIKLRVPGWAGAPGKSDGCPIQPWHCPPFVDASTYGLELVYPHPGPCVVVGLPGGGVSIENSDGTEAATAAHRPFAAIGPGFYGGTSALDLMTPPGIVTRIEPHPSFFTDTTGTTPCPVPGHLESEWWPRIFFVLFKAPGAGERHVFRPGEPYAQLLFVPRESRCELRPMTSEEEQARARRDEGIFTEGERICSKVFFDDRGNRFDNHYQVLAKIHARAGTEGVDRAVVPRVEHV